MATTYPDSLPYAEVKEIVEIVRGGTVAARAKEFAFDVWVVQGYAQSMILGTPDPDLVLISSQAAPANFDAVAELEKIVVAHESGQVSAQASLPWKFILKWAIAQLLDMLDQPAKP